MDQTKIINISIKGSYYPWYNYRKAGNFYGQSWQCSHRISALIMACGQVVTRSNGPFCKVQLETSCPTKPSHLIPCTLQQMALSLGIETNWACSKLCLVFAPGQLQGGCIKWWLWSGKQGGCYGDCCAFRRLLSASCDGYELHIKSAF